MVLGGRERSRRVWKGSHCLFVCCVVSEMKWDRFVRDMFLWLSIILLLITPYTVTCPFEIVPSPFALFFLYVCSNL